MCGIVTFLRDDHYRPLPTNKCHVGVRSRHFKVQGGLMCVGGGVFVGHYGIISSSINMKRTGDTVHEFTSSIADDPHSIYFRKEDTWVT